MSTFSAQIRGTSFFENWNLTPVSSWEMHKSKNLSKNDAGDDPTPTGEGPEDDVITKHIFLRCHNHWDGSSYW